MREDQISKTADVAAAVRASHHMYDSPLIFDDPYAISLTSHGWRTVCKNRFLHWVVIRKLMADLLPVTAQTLSRANYAEACLKNAIDQGIKQYGILSAGLDSFALRNPGLMREIRVFEFDHPSTQRIKRLRLTDMNVELPESHEFVAIDFERERLIDALSCSSLNADEPSFFSWLGTIPYLTEEAMMRSFRQLHGVLQQGSQVVFDYAIPDYLLNAKELRAIIKLRKFTERRGEPLISFLEPEWLQKQLVKIGYRVVEHLDYSEQNERYFLGRSDGYRALPNTNFVLLEV